MTFLSIQKLQATLALKIKMSSRKVIISILTLSTISVLSIFPSSTALASTCSKSDIDFYLQRGFTNDQVVQLCSSPAVTQNTGQQTQTYQAPAQAQQTQQQNQIREDVNYLSAALNVDDVDITNQGLIIESLECIVSGAEKAGQVASDLAQTICANTKRTVDFSGLKIGRTSRGLYLVKSPTITVKGNIQREFIGIKSLRRQDRDIFLESLSKTPKATKIKIRRGIQPSKIVQRLKKYAK